MSEQRYTEIDISDHKPLSDWDNNKLTISDNTFAALTETSTGEWDSKIFINGSNIRSMTFPADQQDMAQVWAQTILLAECQESL